MRVLIACESSGEVRRAFAQRGHFAVSIDLLPSEDDAPWGVSDYSRGWHYTGSVEDFIYGDAVEMMGSGFDLLIAHPPCTYLCVSGLHWNKRRPERAKDTDSALEFVRRLMAAPIRRKCIENPVGIISTAIRKPDQIIQPYQYGADASKATCLWLENLPPLRPHSFVEPRMVDGLPRWGNQTDSGQNKLAPSADRWRERSRTYEGIAAAMAEQWSQL